MKKEKSIFPKDFFNKVRPKLSFFESVCDDKEFIWSENVLKGKSKVKIVRDFGESSKN